MKYFLTLFIGIILYVAPVQAQAPDTMPVYPGCKQSEQKMSCFKEKLTSFIAENFQTDLLQKIPENEQVSMMIRFNIDEEGTLQQIDVQSGYEFLNNEVKRILQQVPRIKPAQSDGVPVTMQYQLPVVFNAKNKTD